MMQLMKGHCKMNLNQATMVAIVNDWFQANWFQANTIHTSLCVTGVKRDVDSIGGSESFVILLNDESIHGQEK